MNSETKICQNCKNSFTIEPDDFQFYERIKVPAPTFCPDCRHQRRVAFRNERSLYKRKCDLCGKDIIAMYPGGSPFPVYYRECWYGDGWDPFTYGFDLDFSIPFFEQFKLLLNKVPKLNLFQRNSANSPHTNLIGESKNIYLAYSVTNSEDVFYSWSIDKSTKIFDSFSTTNSEQGYENLFCDKNYGSRYLFLSRNCIDSWFLFDCVNCKNCTLSSNLRNKEYFIRNKSYSKDDYFKALGAMGLGSYEEAEILKKEFREIQLKSFHKYANITKSVNSTGDNITY